MSKSYICEMRYEGSAEPVLARVVRVNRSRALSPAEVDFTLLVAEGAADIVVDLPDLVSDKRGFRVVNLGQGKLTLRAPTKAKIAGRDQIDIGSGEMLEGALSATAPEQKEK